MANSYRIMSWLNGLVMDVYEGLAEPRTHVQTYTPNMPISPNQLWTFEPGPESTPGFYYIKSNLGSNLVLDAYESTPQPGLWDHFLQLYTPNSPASPNQLWKFVPLSPAAPLPQGFIQSLLPNLVADIPHADKNPGTLLQAWPQDSPTSANQLWGLLPYPGYSYDPQISSIIPAGQGFRITGTGLQAGTPVFANYSYYIGPVSDPSSLESGSFITTTDLGGNFVNYTQLSDLNETPGTLQIAIPFSEPGFPHNILALWNGSTFTIQQ
jgi:hypothetical protein